MQGRRDLDDVASLIMSELTPVVSAQHGAFFLAHAGRRRPASSGGRGGADGSYELRHARQLRRTPRAPMPTSFRPGEGLIGTAAEEKRTILVENVPPRLSEDLLGARRGAAGARDRAAGAVRGEGARRDRAGLLPAVHADPEGLPQPDRRDDRAPASTPSRVNTKTEVLLKQSQELTEQLRERSEELENRQKALQASNAELEEKAELLARQNRDIEVKNTEIEEARQVLEERAEQLAVSMRYKSRVPREHVARAAYPAQLAADPGQAARRQRGRATCRRSRWSSPRPSTAPAPTCSS